MGAGELFTHTPAPGGEAGRPEQVQPGRQLAGPGPGFRLQVCVGRELWVVVVLVVVCSLSVSEHHSISAGVRLPSWWWWSSSSSSWFCGVLASREQCKRNGRRMVGEISSASPVWNCFASEIDLGNIIQAKYGTQSHIRGSGRCSCCGGSPMVWVSMGMVICRQ
jgi:hypothetical protein